jgi:hypothetical protein
VTADSVLQDAVGPALDRMARRAGDLSPALAAIGGILAATYRQHAEQRNGPAGKSWPPVARRQHRRRVAPVLASTELGTDPPYALFPPIALPARGRPIGSFFGIEPQERRLALRLLTAHLDAALTDAG